MKKTEKYLYKLAQTALFWALCFMIIVPFADAIGAVRRCFFKL